jgi:hypothetical protein
MKIQTTLKTILCLLLATCSLAEATLILDPLTSFGPNGDGTLRPGDRPYLTLDGTGNPPHQRTLAWNPNTGNVIVVNKNPGAESINIINPTTGEDVGTVPFNSYLPGGNENFRINSIGIAEDGAIYVANVSSADQPARLRIYRWASKGASQQLVFPANADEAAGDPTNGDPNSFNRRWGDTMSVRGSGVNTEILMASQNGLLIAIFRPTDASMTAFTSTPLTCPIGPGGLGFALTFGPGNTLYGKDSGGVLYHLGYDLNSSTVTNIKTFTAAEFPTTSCALDVNVSSNLLASVGSVGGPDKVLLYDLADPTNPSFLDFKYFSTTNHTTIGSIAFGDGRVYALGGDNGIIAFTVTEGTASLPPVIYRQPRNTAVQVSSNAVIQVGVEGTPALSFEWYFNDTTLIPGATTASLTISNAQPADAGSYKVVISNAFGVITSSVATLTVSTEPIPQVLAYDPFNYPAGSYIATNGNWYSSSATQGSIQSGSLSYPNLPSSTGNHLTWGTASLSARIPTGTNAVTGTYYFSFIFQAENLAASASVGQWGGFVEGTTSTAFGTKLLIRTNGSGGFNLGVAKGGGTTYSGWAPDHLSLNTPVFVVGRYTFKSSTGDDTCSLWVNPSAETFEAVTAPTPDVDEIGLGGTDLAALDRFFFRGGAGNAATMHADEIRIGTSWANVTPKLVAAPQLTIERSGFTITITWPASATGYVLESSTVLPATSWNVVPHTTEGDNNVVTIDDISGNEFLRLRK